MAFGLSAGTIAAIVEAAAVVGTTAYTLTKGGSPKPDLNKLTPQTPAPQPPPAPTPSAPNPAFQNAEEQARQRAAQRVKELQTRASAPATALSAPLGLSAPSSNVSSTVLGR